MSASRPSPQVSILLPFYNARDTLAECLQSILAQSLQDFEIIAVNDFSTDDSVAVLQTCNDSRIRLVDSSHRGIVAALNTGLRHCRSDYVARMDADDIMHKDRLRRQLEHLRNNPGLTLSATQVQKFPEEHIRAGYIEYMRWQNACLTPQDIRRQIYIESPFAHPSVMFRRRRVLERGGYKDGDFPEDYELWLRLFAAGERMEKLPEVLLYWRESDKRLSRVSPRYSLVAFEQLRAQYLAIDPRLKGRDIVFWGAGRKTRKRAAYLIRQGVEPHAWIDIDPKKIGNVYENAETYGPEWLLEQKSAKPFVLNYVRNHGAREYCRAFLDKAGYVMGEDYLDVA